jgi:hypothetical protein
MTIIWYHMMVLMLDGGWLLLASLVDMMISKWGCKFEFDLLMQMYGWRHYLIFLRSYYTLWLWYCGQDGVQKKGISFQNLNRFNLCGYLNGLDNFGSSWYIRDSLFATPCHSFAPTFPKYSPRYFHSECVICKK